MSGKYSIRGEDSGTSYGAIDGDHDDDDDDNDTTTLGGSS